MTIGGSEYIYFKINVFLKRHIFRVMCTFSIGICIGVSCISQTDKKGYHSSYFDIPQQEILKRLPATSMHLLLSCMVIRAPNQGFNRYFFWGYQHSILLFSRIFITSSLYFEEHLCKETLPEQLNLPGWFYRQRLPVLVYFRIYWAWLWKRYYTLCCNECS